jgi:hypothetical protein
MIDFDDHAFPSTQPNGLRFELASYAARLIAEEGWDYASARKKALTALLGKKNIHKSNWPSFEDILEQVRQYQSLYQNEEQTLKLQQLREICCQLMQSLQEFSPLVYGALVNGTASEFSAIHLLCFADDPKEIDYWLLNQNIRFDPVEVGAVQGKAVDAVAFKWQDEIVTVATLPTVQRRGLLKTQEKKALFRTDLNGLIQLMEN